MRAKLGESYTDTVTGFTGTVTGRAEYLHEKPSVRLTAKTENADLKERWVPEGRLVVAAASRLSGFGSVIS